MFDVKDIMNKPLKVPTLNVERRTSNRFFALPLLGSS